MSQNPSKYALMLIKACVINFNTILKQTSRKTTNHAQFCMATPVLLFRILPDLLPCFIILILYVMLRLRLFRNTL